MLKDELLVLEILAQDESRWMRGKEIIEASDGRLYWGVIFVRLQRLLEMGCVVPRPGTKMLMYKGESVKIPVDEYRITDRGLREICETREAS